MTVKTRDITRNAQRTNCTFGTGAGGGTDLNSSMGRKPRRSPAQIKQTGNITLQRTRSSSDSLRIVLADAGTNIRRINQLAKQTHRDSKLDICNVRKRELRAVQKANLAIAEVEDLQAQVEESTNVSPSLTLTLDQFGEPQTFKLIAVVYFGGVHFTARWWDHSDVWWKHDGCEHHGSPVVDVITNESDLCQCDGRRMCFLIYTFEHDT